MMKKTYTDPVLEIIDFAGLERTTEIVTTSEVNGNGEERVSELTERTIPW